MTELLSDDKSKLDRVKDFLKVYIECCEPEDGYNRPLEERIARADDCKSVENTVYCIRKGNRLDYMNSLLKYRVLQEEDVADLLYENWTMLERFYNMGMSKTRMLKLLKMANKPLEAINKVETLPDDVTVYRGVEEAEYKGLSWTTDKEKAIWFAQRYRCMRPDSKKYVYSGVIKKDKVVAIFDSRNESEIVCDWKNVKDVQCEAI